MSFHPTPITMGPDDVYVIRTLDGSDTLYSRTYQATYHSINGAVSESRHVFIQHGLNTQLGHPHIRILEFGFGTGLNPFLSFLFGKKHSTAIEYVGIESQPIDIRLACQLNYASYLAAPQDQTIFIRMHSEPGFVQDNFSFQKASSLEEINGEELFHCIFFDAFSPSEHSEAWSQNNFDKIASLTLPGGCLVTYCARGEVRRTIEKAGFKVNRISGAPGKREMIQAFRLT